MSSSSSKDEEASNMLPAVPALIIAIYKPKEIMGDTSTTPNPTSHSKAPTTETTDIADTQDLIIESQVACTAAQGSRAANSANKRLKKPTSSNGPMG
jgi:hypothetical protein